jgi:hypothetical protein
MATTTFVNGVTLTDADWFNDADRVIYDILGDPADVAALCEAIGFGLTDSPTLTGLTLTGALAVQGNTTLGNGASDTITLQGILSMHADATFSTSSLSLGTISSGTVTPNPQARPFQHYTNGGAHTLAPSANVGSCVVEITNNGSAGAITTSGFTHVSGDSFTTTNSHVFACQILKLNTSSVLVVKALQ